MMSTREAAAALDCRLVGADLRFASVSTDTRTVPAGALFVALRGEHYDGHRFLEAARARGAVAAMVDERAGAEAEQSGLPCLVVKDTKQGLGRLAAHWRGRFDIPLVAITGSNGKTTVKEMIAAILREHWGAGHTLATEGNLNNDIGLPLTLLRLRDEHKVAAIEIGMNHPGETAGLAAIAQPTVGLVNNAQREHQEFMKSVADVAAEHGDLFKALPASGTAVINADDEYAAYWRGLNTHRGVRDFGIEQPAAVSGRYTLNDFGSEIVLTAPEGEIGFSLQIAGEHNVRNAVAAAAASTAAGASLAAVARGLSGFAAVKGRMQKKTGAGGGVVIDDSYNANPDSVRAAVEVLARLGGRRVLVLGDMGEVGDKGEEFHAEVGRYAKERGIDRLLLLGDMTRAAAAAFGQGAAHFAALDALLAAVSAEQAAGAAFLVKGSRFMKMERVVAALVGVEKADNNKKVGSEMKASQPR
jgi:UDP-N-acetylmuramoyl-tripeptide--D-alanyl-D-alanine ligase